MHEKDSKELHKHLLQFKSNFIDETEKIKLYPDNGETHAETLDISIFVKVINLKIKSLDLS